MSQVISSKKELRQRMRARREGLSRAEVVARSGAVRKNLFAQPEFISAAVLHTYVAWRNEVDTHEIIRAALEQGKRVIVPRVDRDSRDLQHFFVNSPSELTPGSFGIPEPDPHKARRIDPGCADLVLVPGVAFDRSGHRLGFGGGYYDDFLSKTTAVRVALAYDFQLVESLPTRDADEPVNVVVLETELVRI